VLAFGGWKKNRPIRDLGLAMGDGVALLDHKSIAIAYRSPSGPETASRELGPDIGPNF
jgi:hypothetical protein